MKNFVLCLCLLLVAACGGGGGSTSEPDPIQTISVNLSSSNLEAEVGTTITLTWSSTNAETCSASGDWSGTKTTSGNEDVVINSGTNLYNLSCSGSSAISGSASIQVNGVISRINITNDIFSNRSSDCGDYDENYESKVRDITRVIDFEGYVDIEAGDQSCNLYSDNIPNHDFNDASANFRTDAIEKDRVFIISRSPQQASQNTQISRQTWDAVMLNGVVVDVKSGGCYYPSESRADADGNTEAGCPQNAQWRLVPLEYSTKFGADIHNAHVQPDGTYHYHGDPNAMFDDNPAGNGSPVIGFAADGFPVYGSYILDAITGTYRKVLSGYTLKEGTRGTKTDTNPGGEYSGIYEEDWEWTNSGDLDECNGMIYENQYGYYVTDSYPFILNCFKGAVDSSFQK